jgi:hypothetical protein
MMKRLWRWWRGYTIEGWQPDGRPESPRADTAVYNKVLLGDRLEAHASVPHDERWHYLAMTFKRGQRRFYFDGQPWPPPEMNHGW